jgi:hypothetical protein
MATDLNKHLQDVLESHKMGKVQELTDKFKIKRNQIKEALESKYSDRLASSPINSGSFAKHTAINKKFDLDLCIPFKRNAFNTLAEMTDELDRYFEKEYKDGQLMLPIRKQRVSIGLKFNIDGKEIEVDIVPGREINIDEYNSTNDLKLYVRKDGENPSTEIKTNIQKHIDLISGKNSERDIIRLLKVWKYYTNVEIKSFFIELITIRAFNDNQSNLPTGLWEKLEMVLKFIRDNIEEIQLIDPANSSNIISDTIDSRSKQNIARVIRNMLAALSDDKDQIKSYFKINPDFPILSSMAYIKKQESPSILKTNNFG